MIGVTNEVINIKEISNSHSLVYEKCEFVFKSVFSDQGV